RTDGFSESGSENITEETDGTIWVKHGGLVSMSVLDGYTVREVPDPQVERHTHGKWAATQAGLKHYENGKWVLYPYKPLLEATGRNEDQAFVLTEDLLVSFSVSTGTFQTVKDAADTKLGHFLAMAQFRDGALWVVGDKGAGRWLESGPAST